MNLILFSVAVILNLDLDSGRGVVVVLVVRVKPEDATIVTGLGILPKIAQKKIIKFIFEKLFFLQKMN